MKINFIKCVIRLRKSFIKITNHAIITRKFKILPSEIRVILLYESFHVYRTLCVDRAHQEAGISGGSDELKTSIVTSHRHDDAGVADGRYAQRCSFVCHFLTARRLAETKDGTRRRGTKSNPFDNRSPPRTAAHGGGGGGRGLPRRRPMGVRERPVVVARSLPEKEERGETRGRKTRGER